MSVLIYLRETSYTCGGQTSVVKEYRHEKTGMEFVLIPGGVFLMGGDRYDSEKPIHGVQLSPYLIAKYLCTQEIWERVMGKNPSYFQKGGEYPVESVPWEDCQEFCKKTGLRLPTEAQWEYACRAGSTGEYCFGDDESQLAEYAWYGENSGRETHPVGQKKPNAFGLYDVHGNVWEWCQDWEGKYPSEQATDPKGPQGGSLRVNRGGGFVNVAVGCRCAFRGPYSPGDRARNLGVRWCVPVGGGGE